jgi:hypothetical protein
MKETRFVWLDESGAGNRIIRLVLSTLRIVVALNVGNKLMRDMNTLSSLNMLFEISVFIK